MQHVKRVFVNLVSTAVQPANARVKTLFPNCQVVQYVSQISMVDEFSEFKLVSVYIYVYTFMTIHKLSVSTPDENIIQKR